jgi:hypothetical protein
MRKNVLSAHVHYISVLRQELTARNCSYAALNHLPYVTRFARHTRTIRSCVAACGFSIMFT